MVEAYTLRSSTKISDLYSGACPHSSLTFSILYPGQSLRRYDSGFSDKMKSRTFNESPLMTPHKYFITSVIIFPFIVFR